MLANTTSQEMIFGGEILSIENTEIFNKNMESIFLCLIIPFGILTLLLNLSVLFRLWNVEKTSVNQLMMMDCMANIMNVTLSTLQLSPFMRDLEVEVLCCVQLFLTIICVIFNRLCPVAIVIYRYLLGEIKT